MVKPYPTWQKCSENASILSVIRDMRGANYQKLTRETAAQIIGAGVDRPYWMAK